MKVTFKLYATLMRYLPADTRGHAVDVTVSDHFTVQALIDQFQINDEQAYLVMVNGVYIPPGQRAVKILNENDTVAVWPKVAGG